MSESISMKGLRSLASNPDYGPDDARTIRHDEFGSLVEATDALEYLLQVAERIRDGDPSLDPEEWYAGRDDARRALARFDFGNTP